MPFQVSPGVNVSEIDLTTIVPAVSTTEGAIAGHFNWGPVQKRVLVDSEDSLAKQFATPNANTATDFFTAASFLSYGNRLYVVRVVNEANTGATTQVKQTARNVARNAVANAANTRNTVVKSDDDYELNFAPATGTAAAITGVGNWIAKYPGELGNSLRVSICPSANAWQSTIAANLIFQAGNTTVLPRGSNTNNVTPNGTGLPGGSTGPVPNLTSRIRAGDILTVSTTGINLGTGIRVASVTANAIILATAPTQAQLGVANTTARVKSNAVRRNWEFINQFNAAPGTSKYVSDLSGTNDEMHVVVVDEDGQITGRVGTVLERFEDVSKAADAMTQDGASNFYRNAINDGSSYIWFAAHPTQITNAGRNAAGTNFLTGTQQLPINDSLVYGRDGAAPRDADYIFGYDKFTSAEDVDVSLVLGAGANQSRAVHLINNVAEARKDCIVVLSPERADVVGNSSYLNKEVDDSIEFRNLLPSTSYAVMDSGYKQVYDKYNDVYRYVPLNGDTAGLMVRTDNERDPWFSPAGFNRGQVKNMIKLAYNPNKAARDSLYKAGINPVVTFPGQGTVLFGDKTLLTTPSAFDRINVRRLFIVLEKAISTAAKFSLFEFNDEFTRAQFRNLIEPFLRDVQGRRGIYDFRVVCDETNNTPQVIDSNQFVGDIYIKPARSINFIQLNFVAVRTGVEFSEIVGQF